MELSEAPQPICMPLPLARNAWLVNLLTFVALAIACLFVAFLKMQAEAETYVLVGVAGSAYLVLQTWGVLQCARAMKQGPSFLSPYFALIVSLLFFNAFVQACALSSTLTIHPVREGMYELALPVLIPVFSLAVILSLPLARRISKRGERSFKRWTIGFLAAFVAIFLPLPLFIYIAQFVNPETETEPWSPYGFWKAVLVRTPEPLANAAAKLMDGTRFYPAILGSGQPAVELLEAQVVTGRSVSEALTGLKWKNMARAVAAAEKFLRSGGDPPGPQHEYEACHVVSHNLSHDALSDVVMDPNVNANSRYKVLSMMRMRGFGMDSIETVESNYSHLLLRIARDERLSFDRRFTQLLYKMEQGSIAEIWRDWLSMQNPDRAQERVKLIHAGGEAHREQLVRTCIEQGSLEMKRALFREQCFDRPFEGAWLALLEFLERTSDKHCHMASLRSDASRALTSQPGSVLLSERAILQITRRARFMYDAQKNSASQAAPKE